MLNQDETNSAAATAAGHDGVMREILGKKLLFSVEEMSEICDRSKPWLYRQMANGRIRYVWLGQRRAITRGEVVRITTEGVS